MKANLTDRCPVCGMRVESALYKTQYHKMYFHFCSEQCRETFEATPQLYATGTVEKREPVPKQRNLRLPRALTSDEAKAIEVHLMALMGVTKVSFQGDSIQINYDLLQVTQARIEQELNALKVELANGWWQRVRRGWVRDAETNELANLASGSGACCNRPPPGAGMK